MTRLWGTAPASERLLSAQQGTLNRMQSGYRGTQPMRRAGGRIPGPSLDAALRGAPAYLPNPQDLLRGTLRQRKRRHSLADTMARGRG
jgi:hypothetical protein